MSNEHSSRTRSFRSRPKSLNPKGRQVSGKRRRKNGSLTTDQRVAGAPRKTLKNNYARNTYNLRFGYRNGEPVIREYYNGRQRRPVTFSPKKTPKNFYRVRDNLSYVKTTLKYIKLMCPDFEYADFETYEMLLHILDGEVPTFWYVHKINSIVPSKRNDGSGTVSVHSYVVYKDADGKYRRVRVGSKTSSRNQSLNSYYHIAVLGKHLGETADLGKKLVYLEMLVFEYATLGITSAAKAVGKKIITKSIALIAKHHAKKKMQKGMEKFVAKKLLKYLGKTTAIMTATITKATAKFVVEFSKHLLKKYKWDELRKHFKAGGTSSSNGATSVVSNLENDEVGTDIVFTEIDFKPSVEIGVIAATKVVISEWFSKVVKKKIKNDMKFNRAIKKSLGENVFYNELTAKFEQQFKQFLFKSLVTDNFNGFIDVVGKAMIDTKNNDEAEFRKNLEKHAGQHIKSRLTTIFKDSLSVLASAS